MIIRHEKGTLRRVDAKDAGPNGPYASARLSEDGGLTQFGAYVETLEPGSRSSNRHWHEREDEFLYVLSGEVTLVENDGEHALQSGDSACWPAGVANAHHVINRSEVPCTYLIVGTRVTHDVCHYPDSGTTLHTEGQTWRLVDNAGVVIKSGRLAD